MNYTKDSTLRQVLQSPLGSDVISRVLQSLQKPLRLVDNPVVGNLRLRQLPGLTRGLVDEEFLCALLTLLNADDTPKISVIPTPPAPAWWKESVFYQIYPRSFCDASGDGVGDLPGIRTKLDYLQALGVDVLWLSPIYDSPNDDMGYDIRDYQKIMAEFGTLEDFDALLADVHSRGMRLILDLVVNHTSDEHAWFQSSLHAPDGPYGDYYLWRDGTPDAPPNNWDSFFSGSAWTWYPERGQWALHLFSKKQMDLNWDNAAVRRDVASLVCWWLDRGVDGFRMDVINLISKAPGLPNGSKLVGGLMGITGIEHYFYGPHLHEYLRELCQNSFDRYNVVTVGETPGIGRETGALMTHESRGELDMIFNFDQLETPGHARWDDYAYDLRYLRTYYTDWQRRYPAGCWMPLFFENHDNPRMVSKVRPDGVWRTEVSKLLLTLQCTLRGAPFLYQGQELGLGNTKFAAISEVRDVEALNLYAELRKTMDDAAALAKLNAGCRDHARTPMPWTAQGPGYGFTGGTPWLRMPDDAPTHNAEAAEADAASVLHYARAVIALRRQYREALVYGSFTPLGRSKDVFAYLRAGGGQTLLVELNLTGTPARRCRQVRGRCLLANCTLGEGRMRPYEAAVYLVTEAAR